MSRLRNQKNTLRNSIYALQDGLVTGIEDKIIGEEKAKLLHKNIIDVAIFLGHFCPRGKGARG